MEEEELKGLPKAGDVLAGRYTIEGVIGAGGMGVVLAARHSVLGQRVAVKFLLPDLAKRQPEAAERFVREARAAIHLKSEHVARVMDVGTEPNGAAYMVMEFLEGKDLQRVGREQAPLGVAWVVDNDKETVSFLGEIFFGATYCVGTRWSASAGYRAIAVTGLGLPTDQIYPDLRGINDALSIESNGSLVLHGAYVGAQFCF